MGSLIVIAVIIIVSVFLCLLMIGMCKAAAWADEQERRLFGEPEQPTKAEPAPPALRHPSISRAMGRAV